MCKNGNLAKKNPSYPIRHMSSYFWYPYQLLSTFSRPVFTSVKCYVVAY